MLPSSVVLRVNFVPGVLASFKLHQLVKMVEKDFPYKLEKPGIHFPSSSLYFTIISEEIPTIIPMDLFTNISIIVGYSINMCAGSLSYPAKIKKNKGS